MPLLSVLIMASMLCASLLSAVSAQGICRDYDTDRWRQPEVLNMASEMAKLHSTQAGAPETDSLDSIVSNMPDVPAFVDVEQDYFDDALFLGDSRVVGVKLYSGWDNITYYAEGGMTVYNMFDCQVPDRNGRNISIDEALKQNSFGKIYLEIGINEMGTGTADSFMKAYEAAVRHLQELQPNALLFLCGIMYVEQSKSDADPIFNNSNIRNLNNRIAGLDNGQTVFYLDINEIMADNTGSLNPDYTWDAIHLLGKYDILWIEYFCHHGITRN